MHINSGLIKLLKENEKFVITCHVNPDADALGSEIAVYEILKQFGKNTNIINTSSTPYNLEFLDFNKIIERFEPTKHAVLLSEADVAIFLDMNHLNRTVRMEEDFRKSKCKKIVIDHHTKPEHFADYELLDETKSSTGEIIFDFITSTDEIKMNKRIATALYAAIMTDTGSFRFPKTNSELHRKVAVLIDAGANPSEIYTKIYGENKFSRAKLLGKALISLKKNDTGKIAYMTVTQKDLKEVNADEADVDGFINFALENRGVQIAILFFELKDGVKISFRSRGEIPVNELAGKFNGGGHLNASGTRLYNVELNNIIPNVITEAEKLL